MKSSVPSPAEFFAARNPPAPQPDPGETLTKYLLALNDTLVELRHDLELTMRLDGQDPTSRLRVCENVHNLLEARTEIYCEIKRIVAEETKPASEATHIVVDKGDEPKSNNTPVGYPSSDAEVERPSTAAETDSALHAFKVVASAQGADTENESGPHSGL